MCKSHDTLLYLICNIYPSSPSCAVMYPWTGIQEDYEHKSHLFHLSYRRNINHLQKSSSAYGGHLIQKSFSLAKGRAFWKARSLLQQEFCIPFPLWPGRVSLYMVDACQVSQKNNVLPDCWIMSLELEVPKISALVLLCYPALNGRWSRKYHKESQDQNPVSHSYILE